MKLDGEEGLGEAVAPGNTPPSESGQAVAPGDSPSSESAGEDSVHAQLAEAVAQRDALREQLEQLMAHLGRGLEWGLGEDAADGPRVGGVHAHPLDLVELMDTDWESSTGGSAMGSRRHSAWPSSGGAVDGELGSGGGGALISTHLLGCHCQCLVSSHSAATAGLLLPACLLLPVCYCRPASLSPQASPTFGKP